MFTDKKAWIKLDIGAEPSSYVTAVALGANQGSFASSSPLQPTMAPPSPVARQSPPPTIAVASPLHPA